MNDGPRVRSWTQGVPVDRGALLQIERLAALSFVHPHLAVMPDVHVGDGTAVGLVTPTVGVILPVTVGRDIGCGMLASRTTLRVADLPERLSGVRAALEAAIPHGSSVRDGQRTDKGTWRELGAISPAVEAAWNSLLPALLPIVEKHPSLFIDTAADALGTLGGGNHFIELSVDEADRVWIVLHAGARSAGPEVTRFFLARAQEAVRAEKVELSHPTLAYLREDTQMFADYLDAVAWVRRVAVTSRKLILQSVVQALRASADLKGFRYDLEVAQCEHNVVGRERHFGQALWVARKGAWSTRDHAQGIVAGSMGTATYIVRGTENPDSFQSCSHGAGRAQSRGDARMQFTLEEHALATKGIECRQDGRILDQTPGAYKDIDAVMAAQRELVEIQHRLMPVLSLKG